MIYLDYAATTPISKESLDIFNKVSTTFFGNPNSIHDEGSRASQLLESCREELAGILNGSPSGIYFTSGGSESNTLALSALIEANKSKGNHLITTVAEHSSIHNFFVQMEKNGYSVTYLPLDKYGQIRIDDLKKAIQETTILASIHHGNGEIGTVQPIDAIGDLLHRYQVLFHCDTVQTFGKLPINLNTVKIDSLSISSHKLYGPKGVGAVYINPEVKWTAAFPNTSQEKGLRAGTVNVPGIAAFVTSAKRAMDGRIEEYKRLDQLRGSLIDKLKKLRLPIYIEGHPIDYLPHILGLRVESMEGQYVMLECNRYGIAISTGSACQVGKQTPSRTMKAIGRTDSESKQFIRLSFGSHTTKEELSKTAETLDLITDKFSQHLRRR